MHGMGLDGMECMEWHGMEQDITMLWRDEGVQAAYGERHRYWLLDAASYYFDNVER